MFKKEKDLSPWNDWYSLCDYEFHHKGKIIEGNNNWKPQKGTKFYSFTWDGKVFENIFIGSDDDMYFKMGNAFKTYEEAELAAKKYKEKDLSPHTDCCNLCDYELHYRGKKYVIRKITL